MGRILFSKKVVIQRNADHLINEPDACGVTAYRAPIEFSDLDNKGTVGDAVKRVEAAFKRYTDDRRWAAETQGSMIGHKLIRVRLLGRSIEWVEFEYAT